jgi:hypothetical protein
LLDPCTPKYNPEKITPQLKILGFLPIQLVLRVIVLNCKAASLAYGKNGSDKNLKKPVSLGLEFIIVFWGYLNGLKFNLESLRRVQDSNLCPPVRRSGFRDRRFSPLSQPSNLMF